MGGEEQTMNLPKVVLKTNQDKEKKGGVNQNYQFAE